MEAEGLIKSSKLQTSHSLFSLVIRGNFLNARKPNKTKQLFEIGPHNTKKELQKTRELEGRYVLFII